MAKKQSAPITMYEVEKECEHWLNECTAIALRQLGLKLTDTEIRFHVGKIGKAPRTEYTDGSSAPAEEGTYKAFRVDKVKMSDGSYIGLVTVDHHINTGLDALVWAICGCTIVHHMTESGFDKAAAREKLGTLGYIYPEGKRGGSPMPTGIIPALGTRLREVLDTFRPYPMEGAAVVVRQVRLDSRPRGRQLFIQFDKEGKVKLNGGANQVNAVMKFLRDLTPDNLAAFKRYLKVGQVGVTEKAAAPDAESEAGEQSREQVA